ncbi:MAG: tetratricopeptide repeat protein [Acidobacteriales bacterium]|nr:tetratricopeptide repeat protein [Terriglobales bacterium]
MIAPQPSPAPGHPSTDLTGTTIGRYYVRSLVGVGGQGEVYCADDLKLNRTVALKRLSPALRADERYRQRFLREAQRASGLNDAHVAGIYDVIEHEGELLLVMEYVQGISLRQQLRERLGVAEFRKVAIQACEALIAAHESGVVHRDIKPENIMLTRTGRLKVLDFGVAKRLPSEDQSIAMESTETKAGEISGTPAYMAPELLLQKESDERADIFSLGVVFYELLTGQHPFVAQGLVATVDRILHEEPRSIAAQNPAVTADLERIVFKMLAKNPTHRHASAVDLLADLQQIDSGAPGSRRSRLPLKLQLALGVLLLVLVGAGFMVKRLLPVSKSHAGSFQELPEQKYLAVLPFRAIGGDAERQAYADGLTETITAKLTQLTARHQLQVAPAREIRAHKIANVEEARKELGVNLIVDGSLHASGGIIRVVYSIVDPANRRQLRAETVTADAADPFLVEDQTVEGLLRLLDVQAQKEERQSLTTHGTSVRGAYDLYLRGRGLLEREDAESLEGAIDLFNRALGLDSKYAPAYAGLGESFWRKYESSKQRDWVEQARQACNRAVALDPSLSAGHLCLGTLANGTGRYQEAASKFQTALRLEPTNDAAYLGLGLAYERLNRFSDAEQTYQRAIVLRPHYWAGYRWLANFYIKRARYKDAAEQFEKAMAITPENSRAINGLGGVYLYLGRYQDAIPIFQKAIELRPNVQSYSNLGTAYLNLRAFDRAIPAFEHAVLLDSVNYIPVSNLARAYYWSGTQRQRAAGTYRRAIELAEQQLNVNPKDADAHILTAVSYAMLGQKDKAFTHLNPALRLRPQDPEFLLMAAIVHNQSGDKKAALHWVERAVNRGYSTAEINNAVELDNLHDEKAFQQLVRSR